MSNHYIALSERDFNGLSAGQTIKSTFTAGNNTFLVVAWNKIKTNIKRSDFAPFERRNISILSIPLTNREIASIRKGNDLTCPTSYPIILTRGNR